MSTDSNPPKPSVSVAEPASSEKDWVAYWTACGALLGGAAFLWNVLLTFAPDLPDDALTWARGQTILQVDDLKVGECAVVNLSQENEVIGYRTVACDRAHEFEVVGVATLTSGAGDPYPGAKPLGRLVGESYCGPAFKKYTGWLPSDVGVEVGFYGPSAAEWNDGFRRVTCVVAPEGGKIGSVLGSITKPSPTAPPSSGP